MEALSVLVAQIPLVPDTFGLKDFKLSDGSSIKNPLFSYSASSNLPCTQPVLKTYLEILSL
jgi:hypothetical protein